VRHWKCLKESSKHNFTRRNIRQHKNLRHINLFRPLVQTISTPPL
jgi:hypothetical protein